MSDEELAKVSILQSLTEHFAQCPALVDLTQRVDKIGSVEEYGLFATGRTLISEDMAGNQQWQYNFMLQAERMTENDILRLENNEFIDELQDWVAQQNRVGIPLQDAEFIGITASNGMLVDWDDRNQYGTYRVQCSLIYEKES